MVLAHRWCATTAALVIIALTPARAQPLESSGAFDEPSDLAKSAQNPVADLISVPLQFNFFSGGGLADRSLVNLNVQPVVPIHVSDDWNIIWRTIVPIYNAPPTAGLDRDTGLGDIVPQLFLTPAGATSLVWGVGTALSLPTSTLDAFATGSWGVGPAGVVLYSTGPWLVGALVTQTWTLADYGDDREVDMFLVQPFVNYNFGQGWAVTSSPIVTASWQADQDNTWTVPLGGGLTWTTKIGGQALQFGAQYFNNVVKPDGAADNQLRFTLAFLFPEKRAPATAAATATEAPNAKRSDSATAGREGCEPARHSTAAIGVPRP